MPEQISQQISVEKTPVFVDESLIWRPATTFKPVEITEKEVSVSLEPEDREFYDPYRAPVEIERDLLVNIETTGKYPFKSKIISIAYQDLSLEDSPPVILAGNNEIELLNEFLSFVDSSNFTRLIGWNLSFDYRFIFTIAALHRRPSPKFYNLKLRDVQQIYQQVKEAFVYGFQKPNKLEEWGLFLLGKGKLSEQKEVLKRYLAGDFDFIRAFQERQIEITRELYALGRFIASMSPQRAVEPVPPVITSPEPAISTEFQGVGGIIKCPHCVQENPSSNTECLLCGKKLR